MAHKINGRKKGEDNEQNRLMGKFRPVVPVERTGREYSVTVHYDGSIQGEVGDLREKDAILTDLLNELEFYFKNNTQNTYKGRMDIRIRLD